MTETVEPQEASRFLRAAGYYAQEVAAEFGWLCLQASVLANIRFADQNSFSPDRRLVPKSTRQLRVRFRQSRMESRAVLGVLLGQPDVPEEALDGQVDWSDFTLLAMLGRDSRPEDPLAAILLAASLIRSGRASEANQVLSESLDLIQHQEPAVRSRYYRNIATTREILGDFDAAVWYAEQSLLEDSASELSLLSVLGVSIAARKAQRALEVAAALPRSRQYAIGILRFLDRPSSRMGRVLVAEPSLSEALSRVLGFGSSQLSRIRIAHV